MPRPALSPPPFSPALLFGLALQPLPPAVLQPFFNAVLRALDRRHPELAERMRAQGEPKIAVEPTDLPFHFLLHFAAEGPSITLFRAGGRDVAADTVFRGPFAAFIELVEGDLDGDALFFSRTLGIEGDMEAALALRNAIESAEIDFLRDLTTAFGPLAGPARALAGAASGLFQRASRDLGTVQAALLAPLDRRVARQGAEIAALRAEFAKRASGRPTRPPARSEAIRPEAMGGKA